MKHDIEEDWGFFHFEKGLKENEMPRAANGQKLRYSLNDTEEDSLEYIDLCSPLLLGQAPKPVTQFEMSNVKSPSSNACLPVGRHFEIWI